MNETEKTAVKSASKDGHEDQWPGIDSMYRLIVLASLRNKQLLRGATPRIEADATKRKNTSIALEEVKQGLVPFTLTEKVERKSGNGFEPESDGL
jgi:DNA-directed RNA polymerase omega subunit